MRGSGFGAGRLYAESIARAGGLPLIVPPLTEIRDDLAELLRRCDGLVLHGGGDINPAAYRQEPRTDTLYGINDVHDALEMTMVEAVLDQNLPLLAICRGLQIVNVVCGGTLIQDLDSRDQVDQKLEQHPGHRQTLHSVTLSPDSRAALAMGTAYPQHCHSFHHQAIDRVGDGLNVTGHSADGVIEAIEHLHAHWLVGVQWHPEDTSAEDPEQQGLFDALVNECRNTHH